MNTEGQLLKYTSALTAPAYYTYIEELVRRHDIIQVETLAVSATGREIPIIYLGSGSKKLLYVGAHHGSEWLTGIILLRFIDDFCMAARTARSAYGISLDYLLATRTFCIVPVLNIDGTDIAAEGIGELSHWQANSRGVDLNHNYDYRFLEYKEIERERGYDRPRASLYSGEYPESEAETAALADFIRNQKIGIILTLHSQGEVIYTHTEGLVSERCVAMGRVISNMTGYSLENADGTAAYGGLTDYACEVLGIPSFTIECGLGENPLPLSDYPAIYKKLRRTLFTCSFLQ